MTRGLINPEIGEILAEFENRIAFLENSLPYSKEKKEVIPIPEEPNESHVRQLKSQFERFIMRFYEHTTGHNHDVTKKKKKKAEPF